ncbi:conserved hypothetical protein [Kamptonema sp. PCC 6506]|nr:conserved hypothetical protein [Kamptonema sp. PCC 6506]
MLPTELPNWYKVQGIGNEEKGWVPKTEDIVEGSQREKKEVTEAWKGTNDLKASNSYTLRIDDLQVISPLQIGGGSFPEGHILPARIAGIPCIPGSTLRGALLSWIEKILKVSPENLSPEEREERKFWESLIDGRGGWQPRKIRFENISLKDSIQPFPLNPQQEWQLFYDENSRKKLGVQWQVSPQFPPPSQNRAIVTTSSKALARGTDPSNSTSNSICIQVELKDNSPKGKHWLKQRIKEMLKEQGIGRGTASGFGRLATSIPEEGTWTIHLTGMKPCIQQHKTENSQVTQEGKYRWTPQVLRACLRGYFTRIALLVLSDSDARKLTDKIFGATNCLGQLHLTSYLSKIIAGNPRSYRNIKAGVADETWEIVVDAAWRNPAKYENVEVEELVRTLLELASYLGGLGPGWRRPPHTFRGNIYRGSQFTVTPSKYNKPLTYENSEVRIGKSIQCIYNLIRELARTESMTPHEKPRPKPGSIYSIWRGEVEQWRDIVHQVCSTSANPRPDWCGSSKTHPSGYAVRKHQNFSLISVFDKEMITVSNSGEETELQKNGYEKIWGLNAIVRPQAP